jgi:hypothetical protein
VDGESGVASAVAGVRLLVTGVSRGGEFGGGRGEAARFGRGPVSSVSFGWGTDFLQHDPMTGTLCILAMAAGVAVHAPCRCRADDRNHNAYILLTPRAPSSFMCLS